VTLAVRRLGLADVEDYLAIRLAALQTEPASFGSVHALEASRPIETHAARLASSLVFGAYHDSRIVGMVALRQNEQPKEAHKGLMWGMYVAPASRKYGVGAALVAALLAASQGVVEQVLLSVVADNKAAIALYERFGFIRYGLEPRAMKTASGTVDEVLMIRFLTPDTSGPKG
jgi:ribosomal protein S18 acetylase RimI-like enzyme